MNGRDLALGLVAGLALAGAVRKRGSAASTALPSLAYVDLPHDMRVLIGDFMEERYGIEATSGEPFSPPARLPLHLVAVEPLYRSVAHDAWDDRGPAHVDRLADEMERLVPASLRSDPVEVARRLLASTPYTEFVRGVRRPRPNPGPAISPIVTWDGHFADGRHRLFAAHRLGITHLPAIEMADLAPTPTGSAARTTPRTDPALWERVKAEVTASDKGGRPGQWSARKAQRAVQLYTARGGGYLGPKDPDNALARWTRQDWRTYSGAESLETGERYLPAEAFDLLTPAEIGATTRAKRAGLARGQQFTPQPPNIARKTKKAREGGANTPFDTDAFVEAFRHWYDEHDWEREPDEERAFRRWARAHGATYLGAGAQRIVFSVPGGALKVAFDREGEQANRTETEVWEDAPEQIRRHLVPVLEGEVEGGAPWILMEQVRATGKGRMSEATRHALNACGIQDLTTQNLADDGRLLDYGWIYRDVWARCSTGRGWAAGSPNVIAPSGYDQTAMARTGPSAPVQHLRAHAPQLLRGRLLDFGSGRGADAKALRATPYDPHHPDAAVRKRPTGRFDTVLATYVLNVLPKAERHAALREASAYVKPGGHLVLAVRPQAEVAATVAGWSRNGDGHQIIGEDGARDRFQRGYTADQLAAEVRAVLGPGFTPVRLPALSGSVVGAWRRG